MIVNIYGKPGAGKTSTFTYIVRDNLRKRRKWEKRTKKSKLYCKLNNGDGKINDFLLRNLYRKNFYDVIYCTDETVQDTIHIKYEDLGLWKPTWNSLILLEEAGVGLDSRRFKELKKETKRFFALHRHTGADIIAVSQTADVDKALRSRAEHIFLASKLGPFTVLRLVKYNIDVNEETHTLEEGYYKVRVLAFLWQLLTCKLNKFRNRKVQFVRSLFIFRPPLYKYFDSFVDDFDYPMLAPDVAALEKDNEKEIINLEGDSCNE